MATREDELLRMLALRGGAPAGKKPQSFLDYAGDYPEQKKPGKLQALIDMLGGKLDPEDPERLRDALRTTGEIMGPAASMTGGIGDLMSGVESYKSAREGHWGRAALAGLGALPLVPNLAGAAGKLGKLGKVAEDVGEVADDADDVADAIRQAQEARDEIARGAAEVTDMAGPVAPARRASNIRGEAAIPSFREMSADEAHKAAARGEHLVRNAKTGKYVGAPQHIISGQHLAALRRRLDRLVEEGAEGADWYPHARGTIKEVAGPNPAAQHQLANELAHFSPQADPPVNATFGTQAYNAYNAGSPQDIVRTGTQARKYNAAREAGTDIELGLKTDPYGNKIDPTTSMSHVPANDLWAGRLFGYEDPNSITPQAHAFMDGEMLLATQRANAKALGGRTDWTVDKVQSAPWVRLKAEGLMRRFPKKYPDMQTAMAEAKAGYSSGYDALTMHATREALPGLNTGQLPGLEGASPEARLAYSRAAMPTDESGRDIFTEAIGLRQRGPMKEATGYFEGPKGPELNPGYVARPIMARTSTEAIHPRDLAAQDAAESLRGTVDVQNAVAAHQIGTHKSMPRQSLDITNRGPATPEQIAELNKVGGPHGLIPIDRGEGITMLGTGGASGPQLARLLAKGPLREEVSAAMGRPADTRRVGQAGFLTDLFGQEGVGPAQGTGKVWDVVEKKLQAAKDLGHVNIEQGLEGQPIRDFMAKRLEQNRAASEAGMGPTREDVNNLLEYFSRPGAEGGFDAVRRAKAAGVSIPVLAAFLLRQRGDDTTAR